ncbi:putative sugar lactone lactonase YvrE [Belonocnema kinseyi]|uniref:putative sugar lactone lactonase YvrE n=1 Tax=Belonocnema kinseyi TaxID=2817044 RepID=UPI00143CFB82|nr:putative sugar lactone lactonase YvrE [Belonocnema kinseyi]
MIRWESSTNVENTHPYVIESPTELPPGSRVGYGSVDHLEKLWFVTTNYDERRPTPGHVYYLDSKMIRHSSIADLNPITGGFVWDVSRISGQTFPHTFYYADTPINQIVKYEFWPHVGVIRSRQGLFDLPEHGIYGSPGRIAIDSRGWIWAPLLGGGGVQEINPFTRSSGRFIPIPARQVGACTFGGPEWETLYVSTIRNDFIDPNRPAPPGDEGGRIYAIHGLEVEGMPLRGAPTRAYSVDKRVLDRVAAAINKAAWKTTSHERKQLRAKGNQGEGSSRA